MIVFQRWQINKSINNALNQGVKDDYVIDSLIDLLHDNEHRNIFYSDELTFIEEDFIKHFYTRRK